MKTIPIEIKIIVSVIVFTLFLVGLQRYEVSQHITEQFMTSKKDKNTLLLNTIAPILGLNLSLGLNDANKEYLDQIILQNSDMEGLTLTDSNKKTLYRYLKTPNKKMKEACCAIDYSSRVITDPVTGEILATAYAHFDDHEYQIMLEDNKTTTLKIFAISLILLAVFIVLLKREFRFLKELTRNVLNYDPKRNNFPMQTSNRTDEVGIIHNAILSMVEKIHTHATLLDSMNSSLEQKIQERTKELEAANHLLKEMTLTDPLTQLANRRSFEHHYTQICQLAQRNHAAVSVIMCDIDHFKHINDTYGHSIGDEVLQTFANVLKDSLQRTTDYVARYGGEEFVIILYDTQCDDAKALCSSIQNNLKEITTLRSQWGIDTEITMSFGISCMIPHEIYSQNLLLTSADTALYKAKNEGRNCVVYI